MAELEPRASVSASEGFSAPLNVVNSPTRLDAKKGSLALTVGTTILFAGAGITNAQENPNASETDPCVSPAPSVLFESPMPSEAAFSASPDGSPTITVTASPEVTVSLLPSLDTNTQAVEVNPSANPLPSPKESPKPETGIIDPNCSPTPSSPEATKESRYSVDDLLDANLGKISKAELKRIIKKASKETARYYKSNGMVPNANPKEEYAYWNDIFKRAVRNGDATLYGNAYTSLVVGMIINVRKVEASGDLDAADAVMEIARAFYRNGFSSMYEKNGKLISKKKYDKWVKENARDYEREFDIELIKN